MTAQIAIMNKVAIALASDSAATMSGEGRQKIFDSAEKLFRLSTKHPVGILVFGNSEIMRVPWEIVIKTYRKELHHNKFDGLKEYAQDFLRFLAHTTLFTPKEGIRWAEGCFRSYFQEMVNELKRAVQRELDTEGKGLVEEDVKRLLDDLIMRHWTKLSGLPFLAEHGEESTKKILDSCSKQIERAISDLFEKLPLSEEDQSRLHSIAASLLTKSIFPRGTSGILVGGFGEQEAFPSAVALQIDGVMDGMVKSQEIGSQQITTNMAAAIIPTAQREMVDSFIQGIEPSLLEFIEESLSKILEAYPGILVGALHDVPAGKREMIEQQVSQASLKLFKDFSKGLRDHVHRFHARPVIEVVRVLPKDLLAEMAETLVSLTSFKRKVSMESETVGGPVDVAVISKGDGFVWIKRKHYFHPELNPHYMVRYNEGVEYAEKGHQFANSIREDLSA